MRAWRLSWPISVLILASACTTVPPGATVINETHISIRTEITHTPPRRYHKEPRRGQAVLSCTSLNALRDYYDYEIKRRGCSWRIMTFAIDLGVRRSLDGRLVREYKFMKDGWWYYTATSFRGWYR